jgi:hypothetical protein
MGTTAVGATSGSKGEERFFAATVVGVESDRESLHTECAGAACRGNRGRAPSDDGRHQRHRDSCVWVIRRSLSGAGSGCTGMDGQASESPLEHAVCGAPGL